MLACTGGHSETVGILVAAGADIALEVSNLLLLLLFVIVFLIPGCKLYIHTCKLFGLIT